VIIKLCLIITNRIITFLPHSAFVRYTYAQHNFSISQFDITKEKNSIIILNF